MCKKYANILAALFFAGVMLNSCATTQLTNKWVDASFQGKPVSDVLVIAVTVEESTRRSFEGKFVQQLENAGVNAVSCESAIPVSAGEKIEKELVLQAVRKCGSDAVLITHLVGVEKKQIYHPPHYYGGFYGYYDRVHRNVYSPGYYTTHTLVKLETTLWDVKSEQPIWSGQSESWNPTSDKEMIDDVIALVIEDLKKNGILPAK